MQVISIMAGTVGENGVVKAAAGQETELGNHMTATTLSKGNNCWGDLDEGSADEGSDCPWGW